MSLILAAIDGKYCSAWLSLLHTPVSALLDFSAAISSMEFWHLLSVVSISLASTSAFRSISQRIFGIAVTRPAVRSLVLDAFAQAKIATGGESSVEMVRLVSEKAARRGRSNQSIINFGSISLSGAISTLLAFSIDGNALDLVLAAALFLASFTFAVVFGLAFLKSQFVLLLLADAQMGLKQPRLSDAMAEYECDLGQPQKK